MSGEGERLVRLLAFLAGGAARCEEATGRDAVILRSSRGAIGIDAGVLKAALETGLVARRAGHVELMPTGSEKLKAARQDAMPGARTLGTTDVETENGWQTVAINLDESPLASLARRTGRDGLAYLAAAEVRAGERLRSDWTRGQLMPRLGANWSGCVSSGRQAGSRGGGVDLTDAALASRQRVEHAIRATGPELSGVLIDVCCFLKGLEQVERERRWPARSAKLMLKTALGALARHYEPQVERKRSMLHWGTDDFRPSIR